MYIEKYIIISVEEHMLYVSVIYTDHRRGSRQLSRLTLLIQK